MRGGGIFGYMKLLGCIEVLLQFGWCLWLGRKQPFLPSC